jgi:hypothetical protein
MHRMLETTELRNQLSGDGGFYPSTQRHYRMLILLYYNSTTCFGRTTIFT